MKIVLDTNVLLSAYIWENTVAQRAIFSLMRHKAKIYISRDIIDEFQRILRRDFAFSGNEVQFAERWALSFTNLVQPQIRIKAVKEYPDDDKIIECAIASGSGYIISYDKHLLRIKEYDHIKILNPADIIFLLNMLD